MFDHSSLTTQGGARVRAVLFDAGGTVIHPDPPVGEIYAAEALKHGARVDPDRIWRELNVLWREHAAEVRADPSGYCSDDPSDRALWRGFLRELVERVPGLDVPFDPWFDELYRKFGTTEVWRPDRDAVPVFRALRKRGISCGIVSNWDSRLDGILEGLELRRELDFVVISSVVGTRKPGRAIFEAALARAHVRAEDALHVGDSYEDDVVGAEGAGLRGVLLDRGSQTRGSQTRGSQTRGAKEPSAGCRTIRTLPELLDFVRSGSL